MHHACEVPAGSGQATAIRRGQDITAVRKGSSAKASKLHSRDATVAPWEPEGILTSHLGVADAGVVSVYSEKEALELPRAYIALHPSQKSSGGMILLVNTGVVPYKRLRRGVVIVLKSYVTPLARLYGVSYK